MPWIYSQSSCFCITAFVPAACIESQRTVCAISNQMCFYWVHFWMSAGTAFLVSPLAPQICSENGSGARFWKGTLSHVWLWADFRVWACVIRAVWNCRDMCSVFRASYNIGADMQLGKQVFYLMLPFDFWQEMPQTCIACMTTMCQEYVW